MGKINEKKLNYLKDLLIPHHGNNHRPHSLHPKRILFHALAAVVLKVLVVVFILSYPILGWMTPDVAREDSQEIIQLTNNLRGNLSLVELAESPKLNQAAFEKAQDMFLNQYFAHVSPTGLKINHWLNRAGYNYVTAGENLAMGFSEPAEVMKAWQASPTHYSNLIDPNFKEIGVSLAAGIFNDQETVLIAQYFGLAKNTPPVVSTESVEAPAILPINTPPVPQVAGEFITSEQLPTVNDPKTNIIIDNFTGQDEKIVKIEAVLPSTTEEAVATVLDQKIPLAKAESNSWTGQAVISDDPSKEGAPIIPASLAITDTAGQTSHVDVGMENIQPRKISLAAQYLLLKNNPNQSIEKIFNISSIYFKIVLILAMAFLALAIFINIKIQHKPAIAQTVGLIALLALLILF